MQIKCVFNTVPINIWLGFFHNSIEVMIETVRIVFKICLEIIKQRNFTINRLLTTLHTEWISIVTEMIWLFEIIWRNSYTQTDEFSMGNKRTYECPFDGMSFI